MKPYPHRDKHDRIVLPKQWKHWARKAGLKVTGGGWRCRHPRAGLYLQGKNRNWRVDCNGKFQCSCPLPKFDRWANSHGAYATAFPQNEKEFLAIVLQLREESKDAE